MNRHVDRLEAILFKHYFDHAFSILDWIADGFGQHDLVLTAVSDSKFLIKSIVPQEIHVVPISDNSVFHGIGHLQIAEDG